MSNTKVKNMTHCGVRERPTRYLKWYKSYEPRPIVTGDSLKHLEKLMKKNTANEKGQP